MLKWTKQEQRVVLIFCVLLLSGVAARAWRTAHPGSGPANSPSKTNVSR